MGSNRNRRYISYQPTGRRITSVKIEIEPSISFVCNCTVKLVIF